MRLACFPLSRFNLPRLLKRLLTTHLNTLDNVDASDLALQPGKSFRGVAADSLADDFRLLGGKV
jgi:hypothetical protein